MNRILFLLTLAISFTNFSQSFEELFKAVASDRSNQDRLGYSVDVDGDYAIVGAYADDFSSENEGSVYVYKRTGVSTWNFHQKLVASDQEGYDRFGWSVAIDGDYIVIGAYAEDDDVFGASAFSSAGSAYIFERDGSDMFVEVQKIVASDRAIGDEFGWSVAISGNTIVVGAHTEDHNASGGAYIFNSGSVYIFDRDGAGVWSQTQKIVASQRSADIVYPGGYSGEDLSDLFGGCVAISGDYLVVGSHMNDYGPGFTASAWNAGAAYIFERDGGGVWNEVIRLNNFDRAAWDRFGYEVAIDSNIAVICARAEDEGPDGVSDFVTNTGSVYIYERDLGGTWNFEQKIVSGDRDAGDHFGSSLGIDGDYIVLGTHSDNQDALGGDEKDNAGAAYVFKKDGAGVWTQYQKIVASDREINDEFGFDAAISGSTVLVGAPYQQYDESGTSPMDETGAGYFYSTETCSPSSNTQDLTICSGNSILVGTNTYNSAGTYTDIILKADGCDSTVITNLTVTPPPSHSQTINLCYGDSYSISGSTYFTSGVYSDTLSASGGCDSVVVTTLNIEAENAVTQNVSICWGETYSIGASTYAVAGTYTDIITSSTFCDSVITTNLTVQLPVNIAISLSANVITAAASGATYQWIRCSDLSIIPGATNQVFNASEIGSYAVIVTENGCSDTSSCVMVNNLSLYEQNIFEFTVFPNPSSGKIQLSLPTNEPYSIEILNQLGEIIQFESTIVSGDFLDLNTIESGVYFIRARNEKGHGIQRFVIE